MKRELSPIAQANEEARRRGLTYGQYTAPEVVVGGYSGRERFPAWEPRGFAVRTPEKESGPACVECGKPLSEAQKRFCSVTCKSAFWARRRREGYLPQARRCRYCGKPICGRGRRYCDAECGEKYRRKAYYERQKALADGKEEGG